MCWDKTTRPSNVGFLLLFVFGGVSAFRVSERCNGEREREREREKERRKKKGTRIVSACNLPVLLNASMVAMLFNRQQRILPPTKEI